MPLRVVPSVRNRFKGLDLIDRVPDELWNEVRDIVQETGIKTIPIEKKCKKAKCWSKGEHHVPDVASFGCASRTALSPAWPLDPQSSYPQAEKYFTAESFWTKRNTG